MPLVGVLTARSVLAVLVTVALVTSSAPACNATHNITVILAGRPDLYEFNRALTATGLADDINGRNTITVLAVDDAHMAPLKARGLPRDTLRRVLSLHVLVDFYDDAKLHRLPGGSADVSTLFQASGDAPGSAGMVEIAERRGGRVAFAPRDDAAAGGDSSRATVVFYVRSVHEAPYNISVLQVSGVISSPAAEAPVASPEPGRRNVTDVLSKNGCGRFAGLVAATTGAAAAYDKNAKDGFTVFCPADEEVEAFEPTFEKLAAGARLAVVLYHGALGHYSMKALETNSEDLSTMASDGGDGHFDFAERHVNGTVTLVSATRNVARVTRLLVDADGLAVYMIDAVLVPYPLTASPEHGLSDASGKDGSDGHQTSGASGSSLCSLWCRWVFSPLLITLLTAFAS